MRGHSTGDAGSVGGYARAACAIQMACRAFLHPRLGCSGGPLPCETHHPFFVCTAIHPTPQHQHQHQHHAAPSRTTSVTERHTAPKEVGWRSLNEWPTQWPSYETPTGTYLYAVICTGNDRCRVTRRRLHTRNPSPSLSVRCPRSLAQIAPHAAYLASVGGAERRVFRFCAVSCTPRRHPYLQTPSTGGVRSLAAPLERGFHSSDMPPWSDYPGPARGTADREEREGSALALLR